MFSQPLDTIFTICPIASIVSYPAKQGANGMNIDSFFLVSKRLPAFQQVLEWCLKFEQVQGAGQGGFPSERVSTGPSWSHGTSPLLPHGQTG